MTKACGYVQVFPHRSMHVEVVNDISHGIAFAITFCPITRSGVSWNRVVGEDTLLLTASGYLYRENLMPLDLNTGSIWSQMLLKGLNGKHSHEEIITYPLIETTINPGGRVVVIGSEKHHYMVAFNTPYKLEAVEGEFPVVLKDETDSYWNIFGEAVRGERGGEKLPSPVYYTAAAWAWLDLYENVTYSD